MAVSTRRSGTSTLREPVRTPMPPRTPDRQPEPPNALSPALATRGIIDYSTRAGERIYSSATKELDPGVAVNQ